MRTAAIAAVMALSGCVPGAPLDGSGPLAIIRARTSSIVEILGGTGRLQVGPTCVTLQRDGGSAVTLVWREGEVAWTGSSVLFANITNPPTPAVTLRTGDHVTIGGSSMPMNPAWVARPHETCPQEMFNVHSVLPE